jgi:hypothetical protein
MTGAPVLWLGLLLGLRHSFEADHVAAVAALASRSASWRDVLRVAGSWGLGHALMIMLVGTAVAASGFAPPAWLGPHVETLAGVVLVALGLDVLRRLRAVRRGAQREGLDGLARGAARRALAVGGLHGLAGSTALLVAVVPSVGSPPAVFVYLGLFGVGSILGMAVCSLALSVPLQLGTRRMAGLARGVQMAIGGTSVVLGMWLVLAALP